MLNGCAALVDDYYAFDTLPYENCEKGKLFLIGSSINKYIYNKKIQMKKKFIRFFLMIK